MILDNVNVEIEFQVILWMCTKVLVEIF